MTPEWLFFDVGSTLVDESAAYDHRLKDMLAGTGLRFEEVDQMRTQFAAQGLDGNAEVIRFFNLKKTPWPSRDEVPLADAEDTLRYLKERGYKLGILANQAPGTADRLENWGLLQYFDFVAASAELGVKKPDPAIFKKALAMAGCKAVDAVMIGDRLDNDIIPAKVLGMQTVWIRNGLAACQCVDLENNVADHIIERLSALTRIF